MEYEVYKTKKEWLKHRGIGSSCASAVLGRNKWVSTIDIYNEIALGIRKEIKETEIMRKGTKAERHIRCLFELDQDKKYKVVKPKKYWLFRSKVCPLITCTPDGLLVEKVTKRKGGLEIKYKDLLKREEKELWENNILPDEYYCQALQYMVVDKELDFVIVNAHLKYYKKIDDVWEFDYAVDRSYMVERSKVQKDIDLLESKEIELANNIENKIPPKVIIRGF